MKRLLSGFALLCLTLTGCTDNPFVSTDKGFVSGNGDVRIIPVADRVKPEAIEGETLTGEPISLEDFAGQYVVMPAWASWCGPCRSEAPMFQKASEELAKQDVAFLGLNVRESNEGERDSFVRNTGMTYPSISDPSGELIIGFGVRLGPKSVPSVVFIDKEGRVAAVVLGEITRATLDGVIEDLA
ncbi:MAG TPA: TlpA disulfide reductase family protein [Nocardioidaceae bacterium]|nr:TlpA disulfide reductase family protein [Nocardioidaceae bacterium]